MILLLILLCLSVCIFIDRALSDDQWLSAPFSPLVLAQPGGLVSLTIHYPEIICSPFDPYICYIPHDHSFDKSCCCSLLLGWYHSIFRALIPISLGRSVRYVRFLLLLLILLLILVVVDSVTSPFYPIVSRRKRQNQQRAGGRLMKEVGEARGEEGSRIWPLDPLICWLLILSFCWHWSLSFDTFTFIDMPLLICSFWPPQWLPIHSLFDLPICSDIPDPFSPGFWPFPFW